MLKRYLIAEDFKVDKAAARLKATLLFRERFRILDFYRPGAEGVMTEEGNPGRYTLAVWGKGLGFSCSIFSVKGGCVSVSIFSVKEVQCVHVSVYTSTRRAVSY